MYCLSSRVKCPKKHPLTPIEVYQLVKHCLQYIYIKNQQCFQFLFSFSPVPCGLYRIIASAANSYMVVVKKTPKTTLYGGRNVFEDSSPVRQKTSLILTAPWAGLRTTPGWCPLSSDRNLGWLSVGDKFFQLRPANVSRHAETTLHWPSPSLIPSPIYRHASWTWQKRKEIVTPKRLLTVFPNFFWRRTLELQMRKSSQIWRPVACLDVPLGKKKIGNLTSDIKHKTKCYVTK